MSYEIAKKLLAERLERLEAGHWSDGEYTGTCAACDDAYATRMELESLGAVVAPSYTRPKVKHTTPAADALAIGAAELLGDPDQLQSADNSDPDGRWDAALP